VIFAKTEVGVNHNLKEIADLPGTLLATMDVAELAGGESLPASVRRSGGFVAPGGRPPLSALAALINTSLNK